MPDYLVGKTRDQVTAVQIYKDGLLYYMWNAKDSGEIEGVTEGDLAALGHFTAEQAAGITGMIPIVGASAPKPARFRKILNRRPTAQQQGSASTFCGANAYATAIAAGWKRSASPRGITLTDTARTKTMAAKTSNGGYYLFPLNTDRATEVAGALGLIFPSSLTDAQQELAFSKANYPKPPRVQFKGETGNKGTYCSFDSISSAQAAGYNPAEAAISDIFGN